MALHSDLIIAAGPGEWRAAWLEDGAAVELYVERGDILPAGSIHLGRVIRRVAGLDAALVDIGEERPGLLPLRGVAAAAIRLDDGAPVIVRIRREAQPDKGALLSAHLDDGESARLQALATAREPPCQIEPQAGFAAALGLRLPGMPVQITADDPAVLGELREAMPMAEISWRRTAEWPVHLDALFDAALAPTIALPGGGAVHIAETAAAVLIDVDSGTPEGPGTGQRTALRANLSAVETIAQQVRLRQLGGGIVIDFIGLDGRRPRQRVREAMAVALAHDPAQPRVLGWTQLGHLEIVRPRRLRSLGAAMLAADGVGKNPTTLAFEALRRVYREARVNPAANWRLTVSPAVERALHGPADAALQALEARLGRRIVLSIVPPIVSDPFDIAPL